MARFFFHLHECGEVFPDREGVECATLGEARAFAIKAAREHMSAEILDGKLCLCCSVFIDDAAGMQLTSVRFRDTVEVTGL